MVVDGNISDFIGNSDYRMTSKNSASLIFRHPSLKLDNIRRGKSQRKSTLLHPIQAHFRHLALARVHFSSAEMDTARSPKRRRRPTTSLSCRLLQNHSISRPVVGSTSLLTYRVVHPVQSKDRDVALRLLLSRLVEAVSRLVEAVSRLVEEVGRLVEARRVAILNKHQDPHRGRRPSRDCRGGFHFHVERRIVLQHVVPTLLGTRDSHGPRNRR